jgi:hypothetical protein
MSTIRQTSSAVSLMLSAPWLISNDNETGILMSPFLRFFHRRSVPRNIDYRWLLVVT